MNYTDKLRRAVQSANSTLCVGLDPVPENIPTPLRQEYSNDADLIFEFCRRVVESTKIHACAYKPNVAFFEALGAPGWKAFEKLLDFIPSNRIVIADAKRGDIGNTASMYKRTYFERYQTDAITLNPLMGLDTLDPFLEDDTKAIYALTLTSNSGSADFFQRRFQGRMSLSEYIAEELSKKQEMSKAHIGMVVGATQIDSISPVIRAFPASSLLIPGIGAQGGSIEKLSVILENHIGIPIINSSRGIIYAGGDEENWAELVSQKASELKENLKTITLKYVE